MTAILSTNANVLFVLTPRCTSGQAPRTKKVKTGEKQLKLPFSS
ncbi:MAG: hypothetical protein ABSF32_02970 [Ignavibacteria bacterium]